MFLPCISGSQGLELQTSLSCHLGAGNWTWDFRKDQPVLLTTKPFLQPPKTTVLMNQCLKALMSTKKINIYKCLLPIRDLTWDVGSDVDLCRKTWDSWGSQSDQWVHLTVSKSLFSITYRQLDEPCSQYTVKGNEIQSHLHQNFIPAPSFTSSTTWSKWASLSSLVQQRWCDLIPTHRILLLSVQST